MKTVMTITGIRPDFVRMSEVFKRLDERFHHVLVHSGQHFDRLLSDVFFQDLRIRKPDFNLGIGAPGKRHHQQAADLSVAIIDLIERERLHPDVVLFLGDSNSVLCSVPLKKEGFRIGHIEGLMRSYDRRMPEEINRVVCDHVSDIIFTYHLDYQYQGSKEGIWADKSHVVGNTIVEPCVAHSHDLVKGSKHMDHVLLDIHRAENINDPQRLANIIEFASATGKWFRVPVRFLKFPRTMAALEKHGISTGDLECADLMSYTQFLAAQYHAVCVISDSGTAQEEAGLLDTPVLVPRDHTERPQSMAANISRMVFNASVHSWFDVAMKFVEEVHAGQLKMDTTWLGDGSTSHQIASILERWL